MYLLLLAYLRICAMVVIVVSVFQCYFQQLPEHKKSNKNSQSHDFMQGINMYLLDDVRNKINYLQHTNTN